MFTEWAQRFFVIFSNNFIKFKNSLIQLHLNAQQVNKLNENLQLAIKNMQSSLNEIHNEFIEQKQQEQK